MLVINLSRMSRIDASGLGVLIYGCRAARAAHVELLFVLDNAADPMATSTDTPQDPPQLDHETISATQKARHGS
jgi:hypothetical protein